MHLTHPKKLSPPQKTIPSKGCLFGLDWSGPHLFPSFSLLFGSFCGSHHLSARAASAPPSTPLPAPAPFSPSAPRGRWCSPSPSRWRRPAATPASEPNPDLGAWRRPSAPSLSAPPPSAALPPPPHRPSARPPGGPWAPPRHGARRRQRRWRGVARGGAPPRGPGGGSHTRHTAASPGRRGLPPVPATRPHVAPAPGVRPRVGRPPSKCCSSERRRAVQAALLRAPAHKRRGLQVRHHKNLPQQIRLQRRFKGGK